MASVKPQNAQLHQLLQQSLGAAMGGIQVYRSAIECALRSDLRREWQIYLDATSTQRHLLAGALTKLGLDVEQSTPGRLVSAHIAASLVQSIRMAKETANPETAQLVAAECVMMAESQFRMNWSLIKLLADYAGEPTATVLKAACEEAEHHDAHHELFHTADWVRELWMDAIGMAALLPPTMLPIDTPFDHAQLPPLRQGGSITN